MKKILYVLIILIFIISCEGKKKHYYPTGELCCVTYKIRNNDLHVIEYFKNGKIKEEGDYKTVVIGEDKGKRFRIGHWREYYSDGVLKWEGIYNLNGYLFDKDKGLPDFLHMPIKLSLTGDTGCLQVGHKYKLRILMPNVPSSVYKVLYENFKEVPPNPEDPDCYPYLIIPSKAGRMYVFVLFPDKNGYYHFEGHTLFFEYKVIE